MKYLLIIVLISFIPLCGETSKETSLGFWERLHIRHNVETKKEIAQPAIFSISKSKDAESQTNVSLGLIYDLFSTSRSVFSISFERQRKTDVDPGKETNLLKTGFKGDWQITNSDKVFLVILPDLLYIRDSKQSSDSVKASAYLSLKNKQNNKFPFFSTRNDIGFADFFFLPVYGIEYNNVYKAKDAAKEGRILYGCFKADLNLFPKKPFDHCVFYWSLAFRQRFSTNQELSVKSPLINVIGLDYYPANDNSYASLEKVCMAIGVSYKVGIDPFIDINKVNTWEIGLKLLYNVN